MSTKRHRPFTRSNDKDKEFTRPAGCRIVKAPPNYNVSLLPSVMQKAAVSRMPATTSLKPAFPAHAPLPVGPTGAPSLAVSVEEVPDDNVVHVLEKKKHMFAE